MRILFFDSLSSTNTYLKNQTPLTSYLGVVAKEQTKGVGRLGRPWHSSENSLIFSCTLPAKKNFFQAGFAVAHAVLLTFKNFSANQEFQFKWPNDVYHNGKKLGGILCEKEGNMLIIGVGLNLNQVAFPLDIQEKATSFYLVTQKKLLIPDFAHAFFKNIILSYQELEENPELFLKNHIIPHLAWVGKTVRVDFENIKESLEGVVKGIDSSGFLILKTNRGIEKLSTGDLKLWLQPSI